MRERTLFIEALEIAQPAERTAYLDRACADDTSLRARVEELLDAHEAPGGFMEHPAAEIDGSTVAPLSSASAALSAADPPVPPAIVGYEILEELGRGGMGIVYKARQSRLKRLVALKMLLAGPQAGAEQRARFRTEAEAVARLQHPNIVQIYEVGDAGACPFLALEFVGGGSLKGHLSGTPRPARPSAQLVETLAHAIHYAHEHGVVHRDLKPGNILLASAGREPPDGAELSHGGPSGGSRPSLAGVVPKIADFGLAKQFESAALTASELTATGAILGSPCYMAPEQATGKPGKVGPSADIYALGAILYELLSGRPPFQGETALDTLGQLKSQEPVPPSRLVPKLPRDLETICLKCLEKEPVRRYPTAAALADDLCRFEKGEPIAARAIGHGQRLWRWCRRNPGLASLSAAILVLVLAVVGAAFWYVQERAGRRAEQMIRAARAETEINLALQDALAKHDQALKEQDRPERWQTGLLGAFADLRRAEFLLSNQQEHVPRDLKAKVSDLRVRLESGEQDRRRAQRLEKIRLDLSMLLTEKAAAPPPYREEFRQAGLEVESAAITALAEQIRQSAIGAQLVTALDEWAYVEQDVGLRGRLPQIARAADPEPWRDRFRNLPIWRSPGDLMSLAEQPRFQAELQALAGDQALAEQPVHLVILLGRLLGDERTLFLAQERRPADFWANLSLANALYFRKRLPEAAGFFRAALVARPNSALVHNSLGVVLQEQRDFAAARAAFQRAIDLDPGYGNACYNLGNVFRAQSDLPKAIAAYERAPKHIAAQFNLGITLEARHDLAAAAAAFRRAAALDSKHVNAHYMLGNVLTAQKDLAGAVAAYQCAIAVEPTFAEAHCNLGRALAQQGQFAQGLAAMRTGHKLGSARSDWRYPCQDWIKRYEQLIKLERALADIQRGIATPRDTNERMGLAVVCRFKRLFAAAVDYYRSSFADWPDLAGNVRTAARFHAACCAAQAGSGHGQHAASLDSKALDDLRRQALAWLRLDLEKWTKILREDAGEAAAMLKTLRYWQQDLDLACVRDDTALATLPAAERASWRAFWSDVAKLTDAAARKR
jgi:serine/threonine-protein kinase